MKLKVLRQLIAAGFIDQVAVRKDKVSRDGASGQQYTTSRGVPYTAMGIDEDVYIHPSSSLFQHQPPVKTVLYYELVMTSKPYMR